MSQLLMVGAMVPKKIRFVIRICGTRSMTIIVTGISIVHIVPAFGFAVNIKAIIISLISRHGGDVVSTRMTCGQADIIIAAFLVGIVA